jgi:hypothetical protein
MFECFNCVEMNKNSQITLLFQKQASKKIASSVQSNVMDDEEVIYIVHYFITQRFFFWGVPPLQFFPASATGLGLRK